MTFDVPGLFMLITGVAHADMSGLEALEEMHGMFPLFFLSDGLMTTILITMTNVCSLFFCSHRCC